MESIELKPYLALLESFLKNRITPHDFEHAYLDLFKNDTTDWPDAEYDILNELFADVDAYCGDPQLRDEDDLDEIALRKKCKAAYTKLQDLERDGTSKTKDSKRFMASDYEVTLKSAS